MNAAAFVESLSKKCPGHLEPWPDLYRKKAQRIDAYLVGK